MYTKIYSQDLFKKLITITGSTNATIADRARVKRPNLYNWLSGKPQVMSHERVEQLFETLGIRHGKLSSSVVHRWYADKDSSNIRTLLTQFETPNSLNTLEIYFVKINDGSVGQSELFNLIRIPRLDENIFILVTSEKPLIAEYPVKSTKLGFGIDQHTIELWSDQWSRWWRDEGLSPEELWQTIKSKLNMNTGSSVEQPIDMDLIAKYEQQILIHKAEDAGLRAIIRDLLKELRNKVPESKLLDASERLKIYNDSYMNEMEKFNI